MAQQREIKETVCGFTIRIPSSRHQYKNSNFKLYNSSNGSDDPNLWKLSLKPIDDDNNIEGEVSKLSITNFEKCQFVWTEAESAIKGAFTGSTNVTKKKLTQSIEVSLDGDMCSNVAFTLRGPGFEQGANQDDELSVGDTSVRIRTGPVVTEEKLRCVYGLVSWKQEKYPFSSIIEEVAVLLSKKYSWSPLRYLIHCTDAERYCKWANRSQF